jgi:ribosomal-protein-alanine N-acetyltransferase
VRRAEHEIVLPQRPLIDGPTALRAWRDDDVDAIVRACQDPEIARWTRVPEHYGEVDALAYLLERGASLHAGVTAPFAIVASDDLDRLLGSVSILRLAWEHLRGEVGYWLAPEARGAGHATRAVRLVSRWAFQSLGLERIDLLVAAGNLPSQRVAERSGFAREALFRSHSRGPDGREDMVAFGLLADDSGPLNRPASS